MSLTGQAIVDTVASQTQLLFTPPISSAGQVESGRLRAITVSTSKHISSMPKLPTIAESGVLGYDSGLWYAMLAPRGTPQYVLARLHEEFREVLGDPGIRDFPTKSGIDPADGNPEEPTRYVRSELVKRAQVVKVASAAGPQSLLCCLPKRPIPLYGFRRRDSTIQTQGVAHELCTVPH